jgi:Cof subfamily protein (haloacid dehalogenase superfamily)
LSSKQIRLFATDLDGTLLDDSGNIPDRNREALSKIIERGVRVAICTGRMYKSAMAFASQLGLRNTPVVCYNGSMVRDTEGNTSLHIRLDMDVALKLLAIFKERGVYVQAYIEDELYVKNATASEFQNYTKYFGVAGRPIGDALYSPQTAPTKLLAITSGIDASHALIGEFSELFGGSLYVTTSNEDFVEMMNPAAGKGPCLKKVAETLGIPMENVMATGDGENDAEMIRLAGVGIAVANARQKAKDAATCIAPSNEECGVAWAIEKYILGV